MTDEIVSFENSLEYVKRLNKFGVSAELHMFPDGAHGLGLSTGEDPISKHVSQWLKLLINWLDYIHFLY